MVNAIDFLSLWQHLPAYLSLHTTQEAVLVPFALSIALLRFGPRKRAPEGHALVFLFGTLLSVVFSIHRISGGIETRDFIPGYALVVLLLPRRYQPGWAQAFALSFFSLLSVDLWCAAASQLAAGPLPGDFYFGIGGAGLHDLLFLSPWLAALPLLMKDLLVSRDLADRPVTSCVRLFFRWLNNALGGRQQLS